MSLGNACLLFKGLLSAVLFTRFCFFSYIKIGVGNGEGGKREILTSMSITLHGKPAVAGSGFAGAELGAQLKSPACVDRCRTSHIPLTV